MEKEQIASRLINFYNKKASLIEEEITYSAKNKTFDLGPDNLKITIGDLLALGYKQELIFKVADWANSITKYLKKHEE